MYFANAGTGKNTAKKLEENLNYQGKLFSQFNRIGQKNDKRLVVVNAAGSWLIAARCASTTIVNHKIWWLLCSTPAEAGFVTALLNASCLVEAFLSCQKSDRDFESHYWYKIPLPRFDAENETHYRLVQIAGEAEQLVDAFLAENLEFTIRTARNRIRTLLNENGINDRINLEVRKLLPDYCTK